MSQWAVPTADVSAGGWTNQDGATTLYSSIDEAEASVSDNDHIVSTELPVEDTCRFSLTALNTPASGTVTLWVRSVVGRIANMWFTWDAVVGATSYVLQVGTATTLSDRFNSDVGDVITYGLWMTSGTYYVRVVPQGAGSTTAEQTVTVP